MFDRLREVWLPRFFFLVTVVLAAALAGFTDVDAITLALAGAAGADLSPAAAAMAIATAVLANTAAKAGYAVWMGSPQFRRAVLAVLVAAFVAGVLTLLVMRFKG